MAKIVLLVLILIGAGLLVYYFVNPSGFRGLINLVNRNKAHVTMPKEVEVGLNTINNSGELGVATLQRNGNQVIVKLAVKGAKTADAQPAHIYYGTCPNAGRVAYALNPVVNGQSMTTLNVNANDLAVNLPLTINVNQSFSKINDYVVCGDVRF